MMPNKKPNKRTRSNLMDSNAPLWFMVVGTVVAALAACGVLGVLCWAVIKVVNKLTS